MGDCHTPSHESSSLLRLLSLQSLPQHSTCFCCSARIGLHPVAGSGLAEEFCDGLGGPRLSHSKRALRPRNTSAVRNVQLPNTKSRLIAGTTKQLEPERKNGVARKTYLVPELPAEPPLTDFDAETFCRISLACFRWSCRVGSVCEAKSLMAAFCPPLASLLKSAISSSWSFTMSRA